MIKNKVEWKTFFSQITAISLFTSLISLIPAALMPDNNITEIQSVYFYTSYASMIFIYIFFASCAFLSILKLIKLNKTIWITESIIIAVILTALTADAGVFSLYRFHITPAMLDLFFNSNGEVISFGIRDIIAIVIKTLLCIISAVIIVISGLYIGKKLHSCTKIFLPFIIVLFIAVNLIYSFEFALSTSKISASARMVPFYYPMTMDKLLRKCGIEANINKINNLKNDSGIFYYPSEQLSFSNNQTNMNVIIILIDSLRTDLVSQETMPFLNKLCEEENCWKDHWSGGNSTRPGVFTLFYGIPANYWNTALHTGTPSVLINSFKQNGYTIQAFSSANLLKPEFNRTVFSGVANLRETSDGETADDRDNDAISDFIDFVKNEKNNKTFTFLFLDQLHALTLSKEQALNKKFPTEWDKPYYQELDENFPRETIYNLAKNIAFVIDGKIENTVNELKANNLWNNSIVIFSADHANEYNDNKLNFWGHNSNFTAAQIKIPLIIHWPGRKAEQHYERTSSYDITATLIPEILNCSSNLKNYTYGKSLFSKEDTKWFISSSYLENAIVMKDQIAVIDKIGRLNFYTNDWKELPTSLDNRQFIFPAVTEMNIFYNKK